MGTASNAIHKGEELAILPVRDMVMFPHQVAPVTVGRESSVELVKSLPAGDKLVALVTQRDPRVEKPIQSDLYAVGVAGLVHKVVKMPNENFFVVLEGTHRVRILEVTQHEPFLRARVEPLADEVPGHPDSEYEALTRNLRDLFGEIVAGTPTLSDELQMVALNLDDAARLTDLVAFTLPSLSTRAKQELLETPEVRARMHRLVQELNKEREILHLRSKIQSDVQEQLSQTQREYMLREQLKAIQKELGEFDESKREIDELREKIEQAGMPEEVQKEALRELKRLERIPQAAAEYTVARTYLDWLVALPWQKTSAEEVVVKRAEQILNQDHYDLEKVKQRILEYLAVFQLKRDLKGPILCFVGPPGVGKTSLGKSIARALGRRFVRISLGGMHDEAEIRGHRRTYIGSLPGQILQGIRRAETKDPVFMLDEVDKLGRDFRGDPAAALLEVLDPEQNFSFRDHYLDVPFDLSKVLFITTANILDPIPPALHDRMEVLELPGYTEEEKVQIARQFLVPKQVEEHGLEEGKHIGFSDDGLQEIIRSYTHEAGVRNLEREIASVCRKRAKQIAENGGATLEVTPQVVRELLGVPRYRVETELEERTQRPGVAVGVAWTPAGGDILFVEAARMPREAGNGRGEFTITGQVGQVMQESMKAAHTWARANSKLFGVDRGAIEKWDVHIHVPAGAIPKDGPSAGVTMVTALVSLFANTPMRPYVAMTGEITLSGLVLPVGGIKEKVLAAKRSGIREMVLPQENEAHVKEDIPAHLREGMSFHFVKTIDEVLERAFGPALPRQAQAPTAPRGGKRTEDARPQPGATAQAD
ncbi:endopeptidase La [Acidobacteriia bacterium AH_259_A11_L15]|nr:endopeptidase La [Acidobacteriia bacterium AH_259_A11_L15]